MSLIRIGDFSQLAQVSTRTLRLYDERDLLKPAQIDNFTGYRYYALDQLPRLNRILAFKDLGFSLEQIAEMLAKDLSAERLCQMLADKQAELERQLQEGQKQIVRLAARLRQIEAEGGVSPYEIIVKALPALVVASIRRVIPSIDDMQTVRGEMYMALYGWLERQHILPAAPEMAIYHNPEYVEEDIDMELATAVPAGMRLTRDGEPALRQLASSPLTATTVHHGHFMEVGGAITALFTWAAQNNYTAAGPYREIHLFGRELDIPSPENVTVEIQLPLQPANSAALPG